MKRIVDIPDEMIEAFKQGCFGAKYNMFDFVGYVLNGTELPKGHGDLIDKDKLIFKLKNSYLDTFGMERVMNVLSELPTIIEADKESE